MKSVEEVFSDRVDVDLKISFFEYGIMRNPKTRVVIYSRPQNDNYDCFYYDYTIVSLEEVKEDLAEIEEGFFNFIGSNRETELKRLVNTYLSSIIGDIYMYNGLYQQSCTWNYRLKELIKPELI